MEGCVGKAQAGGALDGAPEHGFGVGHLREYEAEKVVEAGEKHQGIQHGHCASAMRRVMRKNIAASVRKHNSIIR